MEFLVVIVVIAVIAAAAFFVMQRQRGAGAARTRGLGSEPASPIGRRQRATRGDSMAAAVADHAQATDPQDVVEAERRLQAQAGQVAAGLTANARRGEHARAADQVAGAGAYGDPRMDGYVAPATDPRYAATNGYVDPATDPRYAGTDGSVDPASDPRYADPRAPGYVDPAASTDPRTDDPRYDGRLAADYVDPRYDDRDR